MSQTVITVDDVFMILNNVGYQCYVKDGTRYVRTCDMTNQEQVTLFLFDERKPISSSMPEGQFSRVKEDFLRNMKLLEEGFEWEPGKRDNRD